jgi:hypothetical protein
MLNLPAEQRLLLLCATARLSGPEKESLRVLLESGLDCEMLVGMAGAHHVLPLIYHHLNQQGLTGKAPEKFLEAAKKAFYSNMLRNGAMLKELRGVLGKLDAKGVPIVLLKGAYFASAVYESAALRPFQDIDLLFRKEDFPAIKEVLAGAGYGIPDYLLSEQFYLDHHFHIPMIHPGRRVYLELHWQLLDEYKQARADIDLFWKDLEAVDMGEGSSGFGLSPSANLLYLCLHVDKHGYMNRFVLERPDLAEIVLAPESENRLMWFVDIRELIHRHRSRIDWDSIVNRARAWGVERSVHSTLAIMANLFEWEEGREILARFGNVRPNRMQKWIYGALANNLVHGKGRRRKLALWAVRMDKRTQFRPVRIVDAFEILFPPRDELRTHYNLKTPGSFLLYYPYHFVKELVHGVVHILSFFYYRARHRPEKAVEPASERK